MVVRGPLVIFQLVFTRLKEGEDPRNIAINSLDFVWISGTCLKEMDIENYIGSFVKSDNNNFVGVWHDFLKVLDKLLKRRMKLKKNEESWCWVNFKYEGIHTLCFICGYIGYNEKFCEKILIRQWNIWRSLMGSGCALITK